MRAEDITSKVKLTSILKLSLCDYSDAYKLAEGNIAITGNAGPPVGRNDAQLVEARLTDKRNKEVAFKNRAPFVNCISKTNNTQIDNAKSIEVVMSLYNLIEYTDN